jgi:hypothetical protein
VFQPLFQPEYFCCAKFVRLGYLVWLGEMPASSNCKHWRRGNDQRENVIAPQPRRAPITVRRALRRALYAWDPRAVAHRFLRLRELVFGVVAFAISPSLLFPRCNVAWRIDIWRPDRQLLTWGLEQTRRLLTSVHFPGASLFVCCS